jgi:hypothetical protein
MWGIRNHAGSKTLVSKAPCEHEYASARFRRSSIELCLVMADNYAFIGAHCSFLGISYILEC